MASLSLNLDSRSAKHGMSAVRIRISHNGTNCFIPTGVKVEPEFFDQENLRQPISKKADMAKMKNEQIAVLIRKYDEVTFDLQRSDDVNFSLLTANDIRTYIIGERAAARKRVSKATNKSRLDFLDWFDKFVQSRQTENTIRHYAYIWRLLCQYCKDRQRKTIYIDEIDYAMLVDIKKWVTTGRKDATRYKMEAYMRAAYKEAQRYKYISRDDDPYIDYRVDKPERNNEEIEVIELSDLRRFLSVDLSNQKGAAGLEKARDIIWASFCMCGINLCDMYHMPHTDGSDISYIRRKVRNRKNVRKTHAAIGMELEEIIKRYAGKDYLFNWKETVPNYYSFQRRLNDRCSVLNKIVGTKVNMQLIRHTWATIAGEIGVDWHTVDKSLGHVDTNVTDTNYMRFSWQNAAEQNRKVIEYVLEGVAPNSVKVPRLYPR